MVEITHDVRVRAWLEVWKEGFKQGFREGYEQARREVTETVARRMLEAGRLMAEITYVTRLSAAEVRKLTKKEVAPRSRKRLTASSASP